MIFLKKKKKNLPLHRIWGSLPRVLNGGGKPCDLSSGQLVMQSDPDKPFYALWRIDSSVMGRGGEAGRSVSASTLSQPAPEYIILAAPHHLSHPPSSSRRTSYRSQSQASSAAQPSHVRDVQLSCCVWLEQRVSKTVVIFPGFTTLLKVGKYWFFFFFH